MLVGFVLYFKQINSTNRKRQNRQWNYQQILMNR